MDELEETMLLDSAATKWLLLFSNDREFSIHPVNMEREHYGEFHHLYKKLRIHPGRFFQYLRMQKETFDYMHDLVSPKLQKNWCNLHRNPILQEERLVLTLRYLATGASFRHLSFSFRMGVSTVSNIVKETVEALWEVLQPIHMPVPTVKHFENIARDFEVMWNYPNCIGCIDGKHVRIKAPPDSGTMFYNYKHYFSVVLQGVADSHHRFISIDVGGFGKQSDGGTFRTSDIYEMIKNNTLQLPTAKCLPNSNILTPMVFLGDDAYPLMRNVMKPYNEANILPDEDMYNKRHSRARKSVECAFGILYAKWRIFSKSIETTAKTADKIVKCCCVLQNTIIDREGVEHHLNQVEPLSKKMTINPGGARGRQPTQAKQIRDLLKMYFSANSIQYGN